MAHTHDFTTLAAITHAASQMKEEILMDFVYRRITLEDLNAKFDRIDQQIDSIHYRYIDKNRIVEQVADNLQRHELICFRLN